MENEYFIGALISIEVFPPDNFISEGINRIDLSDDSVPVVLNLDSEFLLFFAQTANINKSKLASRNNKLDDSGAGVIVDRKAVEAELFDCVPRGF